MRVWTQVLVRSRTSPLALLNRVRAQVKAVDPDQQVFGQTRDLQQWIEGEDEYAYGRLVAALFSAFSLLALALAAIGLFSVLSYVVAQRTNEFGIRMALGATRAQVIALVFTTTAQKVAGGLVCGLLLSLLLKGTRLQVRRRQLLQSAGVWRCDPAAGYDLRNRRVYSGAPGVVRRADGRSAIRVIAGGPSIPPAKH